MAKKLKINIVLPYLSNTPSGGLKVMYQYADQLAKNGHDVVIYHSMYTSWTHTGRLIRKNKNIIFQKYLRIRRPRQQTWFKLDAAIKSFEIAKVDNALIRDADIIFCTWWATAIEINALHLSKGQKFNLIQDRESIMTPYPELADESYRLNLNHVVVATYLAGYLYSKTGKKPSVIPNAIDPERFFITTNIADRSPQSICMLYSDDKRKGSIYGIEALKIVAEKYPQLTVNLFGVYQTPAIEIPGIFNYHYLPDNLNEIYNRSAIFISPSIHEGWGLPAMEAMACGCACVCTGIEGHLDFMKDHQTALLVDKSNAAQMAEKIELLLTDDSLRVQLAKSAIDHIKQFSWERSCSMLEQLFYNSLNHNCTIY